MKNERGFLVLETLLLSIILIGFTAIIYSYFISIRAEKTAMARTVALYLAEEEMGYLLEKRDDNELFEGKYDYLGESELNLNSVNYRVSAEITKDKTDENLLNAKVTVEWKIFQKERELRLERLIVKQKLN